MSTPQPPGALADQAFSRAAGASLSHGNSVRLLKDGSENYPALLQAIAGAQRSVHLECYFVCDDAIGQEFARALADRARQGVRVRVIYDWLGGRSGAGRKYWNDLRAQGVEVRVYNPPRFDRPFGWLSRDHRKCLIVDDRVAFVMGLCIGQAWLGYPEKGIEPWRDTGAELRGPAVGEVAQAFAGSWAAIGEALPANELPAASAPDAGVETDAAGVAVRVVADAAGQAGLLRVDALVAGLARRTLWLTDAYYAGTAIYVEALRSAAGDGVDVRLLVPGRGSDLSLVQAVSRAGYRSLLEGGVRVFEWNGPMIHAKTAVADAKWARIGSTNLNLASWLGNREIDLVVEDGAFACAMEAMYLADLENSTEIVLRPGFRVRRVDGGRVRRRRGAGGSASRAAAGALRLGNVIGAAVTRRVLGPAESRLMAQAGFLVLLLVPVGLWFPRLLAWPLATLGGWVGVALLLGAWRSRRGAAGSARSRRVQVAAIEQTATAPVSDGVKDEAPVP